MRDAIKDTSVLQHNSLSYIVLIYDSPFMHQPVGTELSVGTLRAVTPLALRVRAVIVNWHRWHLRAHIICDTRMSAAVHARPYRTCQLDL